MYKIIISFLLLLSASVAHADRSTVRLYVANSVADTGIIDILIREFESSQTDYKIEKTQAGGISVLDNARSGRADIVITHYPAGEKLLIADGFALNRTYIMYNSFAIFGPASNEFNILPSQDLFDVLQKLAEEEAAFMYPGIKSATYRRLSELWAASGITPDWLGYENTGSSTKRTLLMASQFGALAFSDMATYTTNIGNIDEATVPLYRDNALLRNYYSVVTLNPDKISGINVAGADRFREYLISETAQALIEKYGVTEYQNAIYVPASSLDMNLTAQKKEHALQEKTRALQVTNMVVLLLLIALTISAIQYYRFKRLAYRKKLDDQRFKLAIEGSNDGIIDWDLKKDTLYLSDRMISMIGLDESRSYSDFEKDVLSKVRPDFHHKIVTKFSKFISPKNTRHRKIFTTECPIKINPASDVWLNIRCQVMTDAKHAPIRMVGAATDITQLKEQQLAMEHQALHDSLTDLPNRRLFEDRINQAISIAKRHKYTSSVAILMIDLDNFKNINDTHGHHVGDEVLKHIAATIQSQLREHDTVARLGGDEFGILLTHTDSLRANHVAQKLLLSFKRPVAVDDHTLPVSGSIGIAIYPEHGETTETLIKHVDVAMYSAKKTKTGTQIYNIADDSHSARRLTIEKDLIAAIENNALEMHYQPKVDLRKKNVIGAEALLRWDHPEEGFISPQEIIEIAEQSGIIRILTDWVIHSVFRQVATWSTAGTWLPVSINLSVLNLQDKQLTSRIQKLLTQYNIEPEQIEFEITESAMMYNPEMALHSIAELSAMKIPLSIDDFGTGFSSLIYLKQLPVTTLKIDREFIKNIVEDESDQSIVRATIDLGHSFNLNVVAEGVEDSQTVTLLSELGCDMIQGYYVSKPLRVAAFEKFIHESPWAIPTAGDDSVKNVIKIHDRNLH